MKRRVVVTGLGVLAPNGNNVQSFLQSLQHGISGLRFMPAYRDLNFLCQVSGEPTFNFDSLVNTVPAVTLHGLKSAAIGYALQVAAAAWEDGGNVLDTDTPHWDTGCIFGSSVSDAHISKNVIERVNNLSSRKLGSRVVEQMMGSGPAAYISGLLGLGNQVVANSAACASGSQSVLMGYQSIQNGQAKRMLVGSTEHIDEYIFAAFDSMRILSRKFNDQPEKASRPMSATAGGFVPGSGAAALLLEDLEYAQARGAKIYAEILGGCTNTGGQRGGGTMTAPNPAGVVHCIRTAAQQAGVAAEEVDLISGHLTATSADKMEIINWTNAMNFRKGQLPPVNSVKSMIGHCLSAAGSIEIVAVILQIMHGFIHPNINLEDPQPDIVELAGEMALPVTKIDREIRIAAKANFGFGDVNSCLFFSKFK